MYIFRSEAIKFRTCDYTYNFQLSRESRMKFDRRWKYDWSDVFWCVSNLKKKKRGKQHAGDRILRSLHGIDSISRSSAARASRKLQRVKRGNLVSVVRRVLSPPVLTSTMVASSRGPLRATQRRKRPWIRRWSGIDAKSKRGMGGERRESKKGDATMIHGGNGTARHVDFS